MTVRAARRSLLALLILIVVIAAAAAEAAVTVTRAEVNGSRLRVEGRALPNRTITIDGVAMGTSDGGGTFRIERDPFSSPADCTVDVDDGSGTPAVATLSGCTVQTPPPPQPPPPQPPPPQPPAPPPPPSGFRIVTDTLPNANVGTEYTGYIEALGGQGGPIRWSLIDGRVPDGMQFAGDSLRLTQTTAVLGRPTTVQTTTFTVQARDQSGNTTSKPFSLTVDPARPLVLTNTGQLTAGRVGAAYAIGVFADGGIPPYNWSLAAGQLPPGLALQRSPGRITGTPTTAGAFTFTLRAADQGGQQATGQYSITVNP